MKSTDKTNVREVSPGTFRVAAVKGRSAITGHYIQKSRSSSLTASAGSHSKNGTDTPCNGKR